jgi:hypothetical protein
MNSNANDKRCRCMLALLLAGALLSACASAPSRVEDWYQSLTVKMLRKKGDRQIADPGTVSRELACDLRGAPQARSESSEVLPERPRPGREVNHRWVYAACPASSEALSGVLTRRVSQRGRTLFEDTENVALKPGRWAVDVFVGIPPQALAGTYRLDLRFERRGGLQLEAASDFVVVAP